MTWSEVRSQRSEVCIILAFVALLFAPAAYGEELDPVNSEFTTAFSGVVSTPAEHVNITGSLHVVSHFLQPSDPCSPTDPCRITIHTNLEDTEGVRLTSGLEYRAVGTSKDSFTFSSGSPPSVLEINPTYRLFCEARGHAQPGDPCRHGIDFSPAVTIHFGEGGVISDVSVLVGF